MKVSDLPSHGQISWSPDGRFLAAARSASTPGESAGIHLIDAKTGSARAINHGTYPAHERAPAFSPDGHRLAYASCGQSPLSCFVDVVTLDEAFVPVGEPRRLTVRPFNSIHGVAWARDGGSVIFDTMQATSVFYLWRSWLDGRRPLERLEIAGVGAVNPATAVSRDHLAFSRFVYDLDIYRFTPDHAAEPVLASSTSEFTPHFSPTASASPSTRRAEVRPSMCGLPTPMAPRLIA